HPVRRKSPSNFAAASFWSVGGHVRVCVERYADVAVSKPLLHHFGVNAEAQKQSRARVPQVMKPPDREAGCTQERAKHAPKKVTLPELAAMCVAKHWPIHVALG